MRLRIKLTAPYMLALPIDHYHILQGVLYRLLGETAPGSRDIPA